MFALQVVAFYFEYLSREKYCSKTLSFCPGSLTFLLLHSGDRCCDDSGNGMYQYASPYRGHTQSTLLADPAEISLIVAPLKVSHDGLLLHAMLGKHCMPQILCHAEQAMGFCDNQEGSLLQLAEKRLVFLACNDNPSVEAANGGSHW